MPIRIRSRTPGTATCSPSATAATTGVTTSARARTARSRSPPGRPPASPASFPPVSFEQLKRWLGERRLDASDLESRFFRIYELAKFPPGWTWFVDGGVLDNKPFGPAIEAIRQRPADVEVDRRLLYLEPDPGEAMKARPAEPAGDAGGGDRRVDRAPARRADPRRPRRGGRAQRAGAKDHRHRRDGLGHGRGARSGDHRAGRVGSGRPGQPRARPRSESASTSGAKQSAGFSYATYVRLKISGVIDHYAETACAVCNFPPDSTHALLTRSSLRSWAERENLFEQQVEPTDRQLQFLMDFDLGYGIRRLRFVIDGLNHLYTSAVDRRLPPARGDRCGQGPRVGGGRHPPRRRRPAPRSTRR